MSTTIPYSFVQKFFKLSWSDVLWGYEHQLIGWMTVIDFAREQIASGLENSLVIELANLTKMETYRVEELLRKIAGSISDKDGELSQKKWLYLSLAWLFENKENIFDPLGEVESIYADFNYPPEIRDFVRYMPVTDEYDPSVHTGEENKNRLFRKWKEYLDTAAAEFDRNVGIS